MLLRFATALLAAHVAAAALTCSKITSNSMSVQWDAVDATNMYYIAISVEEGDGIHTGRPIAIRSSATNSVSLIDLKPSQKYYLRMKSHPSSEPTIAFGPGWRPFTAAVACTTTAAPANAPQNVMRVGGASTNAVTLSWTDPQHSGNQYDVGVAEVGLRQAELDGPLSVQHTDQWEFKRVVASPNTTDATDTVFSTTLSGLRDGQAHWVVVRGANGATSDPVRFDTWKNGTLYHGVHRISEYSLEVDFLENHDAADESSMPLYLMTCSPQGNCQPWNTSQFNLTRPEWDSCIETIGSLCPGLRGEGFNGCTACADKNRAAIEKVCGNFSDVDNEIGYPVHFFCGVGWPEELQMVSPITNYCVEHTPPPTTDPRWDGFAEYISCNSDETDAYDNRARDPICIAWCWDDRKMSLLPKSELDRSCDPNQHYPKYVLKEPVCNATGFKTDQITPDNPSYTHVGAAPIFIPYGFYQDAMESYPVKVPSGFNYAFPKHGSCAEGTSLGDGGCKWKRQPGARIHYGSDLFAAGWDPAWVPDTLHNHSHTNKNQAAFKRALDHTDNYLAPRCCGC